MYTIPTYSQFHRLAALPALSVPKPPTLKRRTRKRGSAPMASDLTSDTFLASKKISDEIKADLAVHPEKYTMLTGDRPTGRLAHGPLLRHHPRARRLAERRRHHPHHHRRLPGHHRPRHHGQHRRQRAQHGHRLSGLRHRSGEDHHLHPLRRARPKPAHAPLPVARHRIRAHAQPHSEGRAGGLGPRAHGAAPQLPGAPGLRHPVLQGQRRARRQGPAAPHRADPPDRPPLQRALRTGVPRAPRTSHRRG